MISENIKKAIIGSLRVHLEEEFYQYIPMMFSEVYKTNPYGEEFLTLHPHPYSGDIAMQFSAINGAFIEITSWEYIKSIGEKV